MKCVTSVKSAALKEILNTYYIGSFKGKQVNKAMVKTLGVTQCALLVLCTQKHTPSLQHMHSYINLF